MSCCDIQDERVKEQDHRIERLETALTHMVLSMLFVLKWSESEATEDLGTEQKLISKFATNALSVLTHGDLFSGENFNALVVNTIKAKDEKFAKQAEWVVGLAIEAARKAAL